MKRISTYGYALILAIPVALVALINVGGAQAQEPADGEQLMNSRCQGCHDLRPVQTSAKSKEEWLATVDMMIANGAEVKDTEKTVLVDYLFSNYAPLPEGRGKEIVLNTCTMCHDLKRIRLGHRSPEEWEETLISMLNEGAPLSDAEFPVVHAYLSRNFAH